MEGDMTVANFCRYSLIQYRYIEKEKYNIKTYNKTNVLYKNNFCSLEVEPMYHESDHIHVIAITKQAGIKVRIQYLDRGSDTEATAHDFPEETADNADVHLLYRPGHYDILYPKH